VLVNATVITLVLRRHLRPIDAAVDGESAPVPPLVARSTWPSWPRWCCWPTIPVLFLGLFLLFLGFTQAYERYQAR
jgi:hypothetical protein